MRYVPRVVIFDSSVGLAIGTKMDPNYIVVDFYIPHQQQHVVIHKDRLVFTSLEHKDIKHVKTFNDFKSTYPEYFV